MRRIDLKSVAGLLNALDVNIYGHLLFPAQEKDKCGGKEARDKDKRTVNGHQFCSSNTLHPALCQQCNKTLNTKDAVNCTSKTNQSDPAIV